MKDEREWRCQRCFTRNRSTAINCVSCAQARGGLVSSAGTSAKKPAGGRMCEESERERAVWGRGMWGKRRRQSRGLSKRTACSAARGQRGAHSKWGRTVRRVNGLYDLKSHFISFVFSRRGQIAISPPRSN